jgi:preprotein translocase subunit YajC
MTMRILAAATLLIGLTGVASGAGSHGVVTDFTASTITVKEPDGAVTYTLCPALVGNTLRGRIEPTADKFNEVKRGDKVRIEYGIRGEQYICLEIFLATPHATGVVTAVDKDAITIKTKNGKEVTYKVSKRLLDGTDPRPDVPGTSLYPSKFSDVTKGCRIELWCWDQDGTIVAGGLDVIKEKAEEQDKEDDKRKEK